ncbi:MAG: serine hydrolase [Chloroflexi bacterium]|nr:MAG: serine hydrolase [Chloroflexota bacterium]
MQGVEQVIERLDAFARERIAADGIAGLAMALTDRDTTLYAGGWGFADVSARTPVTPDHVFEFGSIGKSFTALVWMQLREEGRVDLHAPFTEYLPWFAVQSEYGPITPHHLLSHTAGIINGTDFTPDQRYEIWALRETETGSPPGTYFAYSNLGYKALGLALEYMLDKPYAAIIYERILAPLGMMKTDPAITHNTRTVMALGYQWWYDDRPGHPRYPLAPATWLETDTGDGCIASTPGDLATFLRMFLNGGSWPEGRLISPESFALMTRPVIAIPERDGDAAYGYGLTTFTEDDLPHIGHGGGMVGYYASLVGDMVSGLGAVAMINSPGSAAQFTQYALRLLRAAQRGEPLPDPEVADPLHVPNAGEYAGVYRSPDGAMSFVAEGERLYLEYAGSRVVLDNRANDTFFVRHPDFATFLLRFGRLDDTVVEVFHGPAWFVNERYVGPTRFDVPAAWAAYPGHYRSHNPWMTNFRVVLRKGQLALLHSSGEEEPLTPLADATFRIGADPRSAERLRFDTVVEGRALRAQFSGADYYRFFTP